MDVKQINAIDSEVAQTLFVGFSAVFRRTVDQHFILAAIFDLGSQAELSSEENVLTWLRVQLKPLINKRFVVSVPCGGIPERHTKLSCSVEDSETFLVGSPFMSLTSSCVKSRPNHAALLP